MHYAVAFGRDAVVLGFFQEIVGCRCPLRQDTYQRCNYTYNNAEITVTCFHCDNIFINLQAYEVITLVRLNIGSFQSRYFISS